VVGYSANPKIVIKTNSTPSTERSSHIHKKIHTVDNIWR